MPGSKTQMRHPRALGRWRSAAPDLVRVHPISHPRSLSPATAGAHCGPFCPAEPRRDPQGARTNFRQHPPEPRRAAEAARRLAAHFNVKTAEVRGGIDRREYGGAPDTDSAGVSDRPSRAPAVPRFSDSCRETHDRPHEPSASVRPGRARRSSRSASRPAHYVLGSVPHVCNSLTELVFTLESMPLTSTSPRNRPHGRQYPRRRGAPNAGRTSLRSRTSGATASSRCPSQRQSSGIRRELKSSSRGRNRH